MSAPSPPPDSKPGIYILGFVILLLFIFAFGLRMMWFFGAPPLPELLDRLPDSQSDADQQIFLSRLRTAFPAGTQEADLTGALQRQGFKLDAAGERGATYDRAAGLNDKCRRSGNIHWTADAQGRLLDVTGGYYQHCPRH
ncbi:MAG: hypothetical protein CTY15_12540 [Methylocystis sp.]|nr:MAG: hypothetical protein CTY15_12540 [Methylocystis sp.]